MISRQRAILRLIQNEGGEVSKLRLVKLAFLLRQRSRAASKGGLYDFIPYLHGPYSFTLNHELRALERDSWLRVLDASIRNERDSSSEPIEKGFCYEIDELSKEFRTFSTDSLVNDVYLRFPWYTANAKNHEIEVEVKARLTIDLNVLSSSG